MPTRTSLSAAHVRELTAVVTQLRRALRRSIRLDPAWQSRPIAQVEVLQMLRETGPVRLGDLATRLNLAQSTVSTLVSSLVSDELISREVDVRDRRAMVVALSPAGRAQLTAWDAAHRRRLGAALRSLDEQDRASLSAALPALSRLAGALNAEAGS